jgi:hypothetical protein
MKPARPRPTIAESTTTRRPLGLRLGGTCTSLLVFTGVSLVEVMGGLGFLLSFG